MSGTNSRTTGRYTSGTRTKKNQVQNDKEDVPVERQQPVELRRSGRTTRKPSRYLLLGESYQAITIDREEDPVNYKEALEDVDA